MPSAEAALVAASSRSSARLRADASGWRVSRTAWSYCVRATKGAACWASLREPMLPALTQALTRDPSDAVRLDAVRLIGESRHQIPDAGAILAPAQNDPNAEVRQAARDFLTALATPRSPEAEAAAKAAAAESARTRP